MMTDRLFLLLKLRSDPDSFWMFKKIRKTCLDSTKEVRAHDISPNGVVRMSERNYIITNRGNWVRTQ